MDCIAITAENEAAFLPYIVQNQQCHLTERDVRGMGLVEDTHTCGAIIWRAGGEILSLYVDPLMRGRGGGRLLTGAAKRLAFEEGAKSMAADYVFDTPEENAALAEWLEKDGFEPPELKGLHYEGNTARASKAPKLRNAPQEGRGLVPLAQVAPGMADAFGRTMEVHPLLWPENAQGELDREVSLCCFHGEELVGYVLFSVLEHVLYLSAAVFANGNPTDVYRTVRAGMGRALCRYPDTTLHICALHPGIAGMIERISDGLYDRRTEEWRSVCLLHASPGLSPKRELSGLTRAADTVGFAAPVLRGALSEQELPPVSGKK